MAQKEKLERIVGFQAGHDCIRFEYKLKFPRCAPGTGGSHGVHGVEIRWLRAERLRSYVHTCERWRGAVDFSGYYGHVFGDKPYPKAVEYPMPLRGGKEKTK